MCVCVGIVFVLILYPLVPSTKDLALIWKPRQPHRYDSSRLRLRLRPRLQLCPRSQLRAAVRCAAQTLQLSGIFQKVAQNECECECECDCECECECEYECALNHSSSSCSIDRGLHISGSSTGSAASASACSSSFSSTSSCIYMICPDDTLFSPV